MEYNIYYYRSNEAIFANFDKICIEHQETMFID